MYGRVADIYPMYESNVTIPYMEFLGMSNSSQTRSLTNRVLEGLRFHLSVDDRSRRCVLIQRRALFAPAMRAFT